MTVAGMCSSSLEYHNERKAINEQKRHDRETETLILIMEEENAVEAI